MCASFLCNDANTNTELPLKVNTVMIVIDSKLWHIYRPRCSELYKKKKRIEIYPNNNETKTRKEKWRVAKERRKKKKERKREKMRFQGSVHICTADTNFPKRRKKKTTCNERKKKRKKKWESRECPLTILPIEVIQITNSTSMLRWSIWDFKLK